MLFAAAPADLSYLLRHQRYCGSKWDQNTRCFSPANPRACPTTASVPRPLTKYGASRVQGVALVPGPLRNTQKPRKECTRMAICAQKRHKGACFHLKGAQTRRNRRPAVKIEFWASARPLEAHSGLFRTAKECSFQPHRRIGVIV